MNELGEAMIGAIKLALQELAGHNDGRVAREARKFLKQIDAAEAAIDAGDEAESEILLNEMNADYVDPEADEVDPRYMETGETATVGKDVPLYEGTEPWPPVATVAKFDGVPGTTTAPVAVTDEFTASPAS